MPKPPPSATPQGQQIFEPINAGVLLEQYKLFMFDMPVKAYQFVTGAIASFADKQVQHSGISAVVAVPLGIIVRNSAAGARAVSTGKYGIGYAGGAIGAIGAWILAAKAVMVSAPLAPLAATVAGKALTIALGVAVATPVAVPAFAVGMLAAATGAGAVVSSLSILPAFMNFSWGLGRTMDRIRGRKQPETATEGPAAPQAPQDIDANLALSNNLTFKKIKVNFSAKARHGQPPEALPTAAIGGKIPEQAYPRP
jgi:hypothetical protein